MTKAQEISKRYSDDGQIWRDANEVYLETACREADASEAEHNTGRRFTFSDGSVITTSGGGWDFGYAECFCWAGVGHTDDCEASRKEPEPSILLVQAMDSGEVFVTDNDGRLWCGPLPCDEWKDRETNEIKADLDLYDFALDHRVEDEDYDPDWAEGFRFLLAQ